MCCNWRKRAIVQPMDLACLRRSLQLPPPPLRRFRERVQQALASRRRQRPETGKLGHLVLALRHSPRFIGRLPDIPARLPEGLRRNRVVDQVVQGQAIECVEPADLRQIPRAWLGAGRFPTSKWRPWLPPARSRGAPGTSHARREIPSAGHRNRSWAPFSAPWKRLSFPFG